MGADEKHDAAWHDPTKRRPGHAHLCHPDDPACAPAAEVTTHRQVRTASPTRGQAVRPGHVHPDRPDVAPPLPPVSSGAAVTAPIDRHALVIEMGDCSFAARCYCGKLLGVTRPDQSFDLHARAWERHVMTEVPPEERPDI